MKTCASGAGRAKVDVPLLDLKAQWATIKDDVTRAVLDVLEREVALPALAAPHDPEKSRDQDHGPADVPDLNPGPDLSRGDAPGLEVGLDLLDRLLGLGRSLRSHGLP